jgi:hypothetical protein
MSKHTPGPWKVSHEANGQWTIFAENYDVTSIPDDPDYGRPSEDPANARLIAAAPEMLEALKQVVQDCRCSVKERFSGHLVDCSVPHALNVIAKAEGREP